MRRTSPSSFTFFNSLNERVARIALKMKNTYHRFVTERITILQDAVNLQIGDLVNRYFDNLAAVEMLRLF